MLAISRRTLGLHLCCPRAAAIGKNKYLAGETSSGLTIEVYQLFHEDYGRKEQTSAR
ncbi:uncharacterized protein LOC119768044 isoform X2 [Culex quinquefasciatus]|uniref:uncharacterized protein LOC119768044 isoform X2 n=1 Tax=Culex quinquefasciatus TaxID=7176 RepID=UPI0018E3C633|nr:uncharacterized protein LOC119768044 isoform X2 [Culex quinquefasciatus]